MAAGRRNRPAPGRRAGAGLPNVYEKLGLRPVVNANGPMTRLGGGIMAPAVAEAMREATQHCVDMPELQASASRIIAEVTGAEAGIVTSGASAAILLGTAACITGLDAAKMDLLPDATGMVNEVIVVRSQRNSYDHAVRAAGAKLIEVGLSDRHAGTGARDAERWEIAAAMSERTAAVYYLAKPHSRPSLAEVASAAHKAGVPVLVDAAAELPPAANLRRFISEGADLVAFSGGKAIGGPQGSGILCGRRKLIAAALLQQLDLDYGAEEWRPPREFFDKRVLSGLPRHGLGRSCKVGKEQIVGLLTALKIFAAETEAARRHRLTLTAEGLAAALARLPWLSARVMPDPEGSGLPVVEIDLAGGRAGLTGTELIKRLRSGQPRVEINPWQAPHGPMILSVTCLREGDPKIIAKRFSEILRRKTG